MAKKTTPKKRPPTTEPRRPRRRSVLESRADVGARAAITPGGFDSFAQFKMARHTHALQAHARALEAYTRAIASREHQAEPTTAGPPKRRDLRRDFAAFFKRNPEAARSTLSDRALVKLFADQQGYAVDRTTMNRHRRAYH